MTLGSDLVVVKGRICHFSISDVEHEQVIYRSGIEFVEPSGKVHGVIARFVGTLKAGRQGG